MWTKPPSVYEDTIPSSQRMIKITAMVQSKSIQTLLESGFNLGRPKREARRLAVRGGTTGKRKVKAPATTWSPCSAPRGTPPRRCLPRHLRSPSRPPCCVAPVESRFCRDRSTHPRHPAPCCESSRACPRPTVVRIKGQAPLQLPAQSQRPRQPAASYFDCESWCSPFCSIL